MSALWPDSHQDQGLQGMQDYFQGEIMTGQQPTIILEFHELQRIHDYLKISSRKKDDTLLKIKSIIMQMQDSKKPPSCLQNNCG